MDSRFKRESTGDTYTEKHIPASELEVLTRGGWVPITTTKTASHAIHVYQEPLYTPREALAYLSQKALHITGVLDDRLLAQSKTILLNAVKFGEPLGDTTAKLNDLFLPYVGDPDVLRDGEPIQPAQLNTVVRTNATDAYSMGRLIAARDPDLEGLIRGMLYSAVLDERTTPVCRYLDGKVIPMDEPRLDQLVPPNHFNCRSILVPVPVGVPIDEGDFITQAEIGRALGLVQEGFK